jgi:hypothetical protein
MKKSESQIQQEIQMFAATIGCQLMRNNSGAFEDKNTGRYIFFGLGNISKQHGERIKSSDLIGFWKGRFIAIEVKKEGWVFNPNDKREQAQLSFINWCNSNLCIAGFCTSVDDFKKLLGI